MIDTGNQVSIIPFSFLNKIVNIKVGKTSPWLKNRVANDDNLKGSYEGKVEAVRKWPDNVKELRSCMVFVAYTLVYYSKFMKYFTTMISPLQQSMVDVNN